MNNIITKQSKMSNKPEVKEENLISKKIEEQKDEFWHDLKIVLSKIINKKDPSCFTFVQPSRRYNIFRFSI